MADEKILKKITAIEKTLTKQAVVLDEHVKRSTMLEQIVLPMQEKMAEFTGSVKFVKFMFTILGSLAAIVETVRLFWR